MPETETEDCPHDSGSYEDTLTRGDETAKIARCNRCKAMTSSRGR